MTVLILGGSGSGKSAYAEETALALAGEGAKYYLATMEAGDGEALERVNRHRQMRKGKGFVTLEQPRSAGEALSRMGEKAQGATVLLECLSNLTANEMFSEEPPLSWQETADRIWGDLCRLAHGVGHLVVVTGNVFEDGVIYGETTAAYQRALGALNRLLAAEAGRVVEVVAGIPVTVKG